ncbi:MAG TPA: rhodanese-like domain-containing protein [Ktedonobacterales bacterium]|jgi:rhodanese-related sulfurtransferase
MTTGDQPREMLLTLFAQTRALVHEFADSRSADERTERGDKRWSAAEVLAASGAWMDYSADRIGYFQRGETAPQSVDFDAVNVAAIAAAENRSWEEILAGVDAAQGRLSATVAASPPELLEATNTYGDGPGGPLWGETRANGFIWPVQEMLAYERSHGRADRVAALQAALTPVIGAPAECELISPDALAEKLATPDAPLVLDVRDAEEYAEGHLAGAANSPMDNLASAALPTDRLIVTYCNMHNPGYSRGERAAEELSARGYRVMALEGGYPAWAEGGHPVETPVGE